MQRYGFAERCRNGRIPVAGTLVDESAGSSGKAVQLAALGEGAARRAPEHVQLGAVHVPDRAPVRDQRVLDGRLGDRARTWGSRSSQVCMVKSTGPDLPEDRRHDRDVRRGLRLPRRGVSAFPQARRRRARRARLRLDADARLRPRRRRRDDRGDARPSRAAPRQGALGLRGLRHPDRDRRRDGSLVWVRKLLVERPDAREALLGAGEERTPMVFQYNPLENYIELNDGGETLVTVNNLSVLSPKLRYNVGDEGLPMTRRGRPAPAGFASGGRRAVSRCRGLGIAVLLPLRAPRQHDLVHGREHLPARRRVRPLPRRALAAAIESFCLELEESAELESRPVVHVQLRARVAVDERGGRRAAAAGARRPPGVARAATSPSRSARIPPLPRSSSSCTSTAPGRSQACRRRSRTSTSCARHEDDRPEQGAAVRARQRGLRRRDAVLRACARCSRTGRSGSGCAAGSSARRGSAGTTSTTSSRSPSVRSSSSRRWIRCSASPGTSFTGS